MNNTNMLNSWFRIWRFTFAVLILFALGLLGGCSEKKPREIETSSRETSETKKEKDETETDTQDKDGPQDEKKVKVPKSKSSEWLKKGLDARDSFEKVRCYGEAIKCNPRNSEAYFNRGLAYYNMDNYSRASHDFTSTIDLDPTHSEAYYNRGRILFSKGNYAGAIKDYTEAIFFAPKKCC